MSFYTVKVRKARKAHQCGAWCRTIQPGELYLEHKEFPGGDAGYADGAGHPVRLAECSDCAHRYGRGELLFPVLEGQATIEDALCPA